MGEDWTGAFPVEDALEMVLMFDGAGEITYANAAARRRLGYAPEDTGIKERLPGRHIHEVFPGGVPGSEAPAPDNGERPHLVMYRRNRTCFPVEVKVVRDEARGVWVSPASI